MEMSLAIILLFISSGLCFIIFLLLKKKESIKKKNKQESFNSQEQVQEKIEQQTDQEEINPYQKYLSPEPPINDPDSSNVRLNISTSDYYNDPTQSLILPPYNPKK